jgi:hypothetical protein
MLNLPHSLTRHFRDAAGNFDYRALLRTPDYHLVALARQLPPGEQAELYCRLQGLRLSWFEKMLARAAGVDVDVQQRRFLRILQEAALEPATA